MAVEDGIRQEDRRFRRLVQFGDNQSSIGMPINTVTLGIGGVLGHDANAALLVNGALIGASQEERFTRRKHDGTFPVQSISDCLSRAQLTAADVTDVIFAEKPLQSHFFDLCGRPGNRLTRALGRIFPESIGSLYVQQARAMMPAARFHYAWHHHSHVVGAFHSSHFERAAYLCVDGKGEDYSASAGLIDSESIQPRWEQGYANGLGMFYTLITYHLGFASFGSEYKVMGLAPYGRPTRTQELSRLFTTDEKGGFRLVRDFPFTDDAILSARDWIEEVTGIPRRHKADELREIHVDVAASLQQIFEQELLKMAAFIRTDTGATNLIFCGGCAQNCVAAGKLRASGLFREVFNSPVGGDMASGLGAALLLERNRPSAARQKWDFRGFYLGGDPGLLPAEAEPWSVAYQGSIHAAVAQLLADAKIVAVVRGGMELGARALGARSILADPRAPGMQSRLNLAVKFRESFRPFAPAVLATRTAEWFDSAAESNFMNYTAYLREEHRTYPPAGEQTLRERLDFPRCRIPSVIHVDYSARLQTVRPEVHPDFHQFITEFDRLTGIPILINTSFNVAGQPIVRTAAEGWECFVNTDIDYLVLGERLYINPQQKTREEKIAWLKQFAKSA